MRNLSNAELLVARRKRASLVHFIPLDEAIAIIPANSRSIKDALVDKAEKCLRETRSALSIYGLASSDIWIDCESIEIVVTLFFEKLDCKG